MSRRRAAAPKEAATADLVVEDQEEDEEEEEEVAVVKGAKASSKDDGKAGALTVKTSAGFNALNTRLMAAGKVRSVRLNLHGSSSNSSSSSSSSSSFKSRPNAIEVAQASAGIYDTSTLEAPPLKPPKPAQKKTLGKGWFDLEPAVMDDNLKRDIKMIQMRNYIDPKRFYKNPDKTKAVLHVGTVVEGPGEYKSSRLTKKERRTSIVGEILADSQIKQYTKRKYLEIQAEKPHRKRKSFKKGRR